MTSGTRIGILGGTFDPVHVGHVDTALAAQRALALDRVLVMPSGTPPHRSVASLGLALSSLRDGGPRRHRPSGADGQRPRDWRDRAVLHLRHAGALAWDGPPRIADFFITGADAFAEIDTWSRYPQVLEMAHFVVVSRPGHAAAALPSKLPALTARMRGAAAQASTTVAAPQRLPAGTRSPARGCTHT